MSVVYFRITARGAHLHTRAPSLERLLARADGPNDAADWRAEAYRLIAPEGARVPAVASAALAPSARRAPGSWVCLATPVHLLAGMTSIGMAADGILEIEPFEADALAADFNEVFAGGGVRLERGRDALLLCRFDEPLRVTTRAPEEAAGPRPAHLELAHRIVCATTRRSRRCLARAVVSVQTSCEPSARGRCP